ncbi:gamma-glutamyltransferase family protein [Amylibacter sp.]|nr:gamma-glutamyltransferase family protein [Amylibacter sp.]MDC3303921.1 gamma-glutamyltransferase family protein [Amylibacter sp.]
MRDFHLPGRSPVYGSNGMASTSNPLSSKVAIQILEAGGNAVDAAIGAALLQGLLEPQMAGIGGDCFILLSPAGSEEIIALNGSGRAPEKLCAKQIRDAGHSVMPIRGVESITMPGAIDAFCTLSSDYGKLGLKASLAPAIHYMKTGVPIAPRTSFDWILAESELKGAARDFYLIKGKAPQAGQIFQAPMQAKVLEKIADKGRDGFYKGEVAEDMVSSLNAIGGSHSLEDFANVRCNYTTPISGKYGSTEMFEHPPNGQGATAICINNILSHFDISSMDAFGVQRTHIEAEATKLAYDARNRFIADKSSRIDHMLSMETAKNLASLIDTKSVLVNTKSITESVHKETICLTIVDKDLMSVSLIYSVFHSFGSGFASSKFGINFQNRGAGFTLEENHPNEAGAKKRPMHTIIPGMLKKNKKIIMPFCVMGGAYQATGHSRFVSNIVDFKLNPQSSIDSPRSFADGDFLKIERGYKNNVCQGLKNLGHNLIVPDTPIGGAQAVYIDYKNGTLVGASDARKDGASLGY